MRGSRAAAALAAMVFLGACGARVSDQQVATLSPNGPGSAATAEGPGAASSGGPAVSEATGDELATPGDGSGPASAADGAVGPRAAATRDNGGATDVGVSADAIKIGNVSTFSGPVPGLFQGASVGVLAFAAYQNARGGIHGRKLEVEIRDDALDSGQNRAMTADLARRVFALAGSVSVNDAGGAPEIEKAGVPDVGVGLSDERRQLPTFFSPVPTPGRGYRTGQFLWYSRRFPNAVKAIGTLYGDVAAAKTAHEDMRAAAEETGWRFVYERGFQATETDFTADVVRMRQSGVKMVYLVATDEKATARIAKAMAQQNFKPEVFASGPSGYDRDLFVLGGAAVDGLLVDQQAAMYAGEDAAAVPEVALMNQWVQKVKPGYVSDLYVAWAWSSMLLLTQAMEAVGPELTRTAVVQHLRGVDRFDANGLVAEGGPGTRRPPLCYIVLQARDGKYMRVEPERGYLCEGTYVRNE